MLTFSYAPACVSLSLVPTLSSPFLFVSAAFFAHNVAVVQASHRGTWLNFPSTFLPLFLPLISPHLSSSSLSPLLSSPFLPLLHPHPQFNPPPSLPSTPLFPYSQMCLSFLLLMAAHDGNETAKHALPAGIIFTKHTVGQNRKKKAPACCVSRLEKSHSNSVRLEKPNWSAVHNYFPSPNLFSCFLSLHCPLSPASRSLFFSLSCSFALLTVATQHWK